MIRVLFEHGRFGPADTARTAAALAAFAVGLPAFMLVKALTPGFFAREDTRTPLYIALVVDRDQRRHERRLRVRHLARAGRHRARLVALGLAQCRCCWRSSCCSRGHWLPDPAADLPHVARCRWPTIGMSAALVGGLCSCSGRPLAHPDLTGVVALLGLCAGGGLVYGGTRRGAGRREALRDCASCCAASRASGQPTQPNNRDARRAAAGSTRASPARNCRRASSPARRRRGPARCPPWRSSPGPRSGGPA